MRISNDNLPVIDRAGIYPAGNAIHEFTHRNPTNVVHLYDYDVEVRIGSKAYEVQKGDLTCIPAGTTYSFSTDAPGRHWCIHFYDTPTETAEAIDIPEYFRLGTKNHFYREQMQHISRLASHTSQLVMTHVEARFRLKALLISLHNLATRQGTGQQRQAPLSWDDLSEWMDENLDQPITTSLLADRVNLSRPTFSKRFKQVHQTTLSQYLLSRRIEKAKALLTTTALTIFEVGSAVGISDPQYFNKQFRKITGMSPSRYREENQYFLEDVAEPANR